MIAADGCADGLEPVEATRRPRSGSRPAPSGSSRQAQALRAGVAQLEAATLDGSVFVVRDGQRLIAATTTPEPTVGLVFYDLKTCLRSIGDGGSTAPEPRRRLPSRREAAAPRARKPKKATGDAAS